MGVEKKEEVLQWPLLLQFSVLREFSTAPVPTTFPKIPPNPWALSIINTMKGTHPTWQTPGKHTGEIAFFPWNLAVQEEVHKILTEKDRKKEKEVLAWQMMSPAYSYPTDRRLFWDS